MLKNFIALDLETTGLNPSEDKIIQIGLARFENGMSVQEYEQIVNPRKAIPLVVERLTGIDDQCVAGAPFIEDVLPSVMDFIGDQPLVAHNAQFDISFLNACLHQSGISLRNTVIDSLDLAWIVFPGARSYSLGNLVSETGREWAQVHHALDDSLAAGYLFTFMIERLKQLNPAYLKEIYRLMDGSEWSLLDIIRQAAVLEGSSTPGETWEDLIQGCSTSGDIAPVRESMEDEDSRILIDGRYLRDLVSPGGRLEQLLPNYEHRKQQVEIIELVSEVLNEGKHLMAEVGTGSGKSLGYLLPAAEWALLNNDRVVISTHTINLQEQLWSKDLPLVKQLLGTDFKASLLKGRSNYICLAKWYEISHTWGLQLDLESRRTLLKIFTWLTVTGTGDRSELHFHNREEGLWQYLSCDQADKGCPGKECRWYRKCFAMAARHQAQRSNIIVCNHSLVFSDIRTDNKVIPPYAQIIFDEAHHLEEVVSDQMGITLDGEHIRNLLDNLDVPRRGFLDHLKNLTKEFQNVDQSKYSLVTDCIDLIKRESNDAKKMGETLFGLIGEMFNTRESSAGYAYASIRIRNQHYESSYWMAIESMAKNLQGKINRIIRYIGDILRTLEQPATASSVEGKDLIPTIGQMAKLSSDIQEFSDNLDFLLLMPEGWVCWVEQVVERGRKRNVFRATPIRIDEIIRKELIENLRSVILTSGTLSIESSLEYYKNRLGLCGLPESKLVTETIGSPFDYYSQALVCIPTDFSNPKGPVRLKFTEEVVGFLKELLCITQGKTMVLFTSHNMLRSTYEGLIPFSVETGISLLGQGLDGSRHRILEEFKSNPRSVLLGSSSFWEGVDVPGDKLRCVVMVRLPFWPPQMPVMEARLEDVRRQGLDPFYNYSLPEAIIRFKQGFGRLIRTRSDRGTVVILDKRALPTESGYGSKFIDSLPGPRIVTGSKRRLLEEIDNWLCIGEK